MTQLTISSLIEQLTKLQSEHGDMPMVIEDADTGYVFLFQEKHLTIPDYLDGKYLAVEINYGDEMIE